MKTELFSKKEAAALAILAVAGLLSYLTGFDYWLAQATSHRTPIGVSLFFSYWYFIAFMLLSVVVLFLKNKKAAATIVLSVAALFLMQAAFTEYAPRPRPPEAMPIGEELLDIIRGSGASSSFFSGHTSGAVAVYAAYMLAGYHPNAVLFLTLPIIFSRLLLVQHYLSDVAGGVVFGYIMTKTIYHAVGGRWPGA